MKVDTLVRLKTDGRMGKVSGLSQGLVDVKFLDGTIEVIPADNLDELTCTGRPTSEPADQMLAFDKALFNVEGCATGRYKSLVSNCIDVDRKRR